MSLSILDSMFYKHTKEKVHSLANLQIVYCNSILGWTRVDSFGDMK